MSCIKPVSHSDFSPLLAETNDDLLCIQNKNKELLEAANRIFGNDWSHSVTNSTIDFVESSGINYSVGCYTTVKVQLANGTYHEDVGYSHIEASTKALSVQKARMSSIVDALIKVLSCFTAMKDEMKHLDPTLNISNIVKTKFPLKRPISPPPPPAQSTPKITKSSTVLFETTQPKKGTNSTLVAGNGLKISESNDKMITENVIDLDVMFASSVPINTHSASGVPTSGPASTSATLSEEEMRLERKRKQREKQEEFKRQMKDKEERGKQTLDIQKPNSKF